jgi:hypothetical protein
MASREQLRIGTKVYFGRENGQRTLGEIAKLNPTKAKVRTLEDRGQNGRSPVGSLWNVPYSMLTLADGGDVPNTVSFKPVAPPLTYSPFDHVENLILEAIVAVHSNLSPENLTGDGEKPLAMVRADRARLNRQLRGLESALGRSVDEIAAYDWETSKNAYGRTPPVERRKA